MDAQGKKIRSPIQILEDKFKKLSQDPGKQEQARALRQKIEIMKAKILERKQKQDRQRAQAQARKLAQEQQPKIRHLYEKKPTQIRLPIQILQNKLKKLLQDSGKQEQARVVRQKIEIMKARIRAQEQAKIRAQEQEQARKHAQAQEQARIRAQEQARQLAQAQARQRAQHIQQSKKMGDRLRSASFSDRDSPTQDSQLKKTLKEMQKIAHGVPGYMNLKCSLCETINNNTNTHCTNCGNKLSNTVSKSKPKSQIQKQDERLRHRGEPPFGAFNWNSWKKPNS